MDGTGRLRFDHTNPLFQARNWTLGNLKNLAQEPCPYFFPIENGVKIVSLVAKSNQQWVKNNIIIFFKKMWG